jgi:hypothetical protein
MVLQAITATVGTLRLSWPDATALIARAALIPRIYLAGLAIGSDDATIQGSSAVLLARR